MTISTNKTIFKSIKINKCNNCKVARKKVKNLQMKWVSHPREKKSLKIKGRKTPRLIQTLIMFKILTKRSNLMMVRKIWTI